MSAPLDEETLRLTIAQARAAWPALDVDVAEFARHLDENLPAGAADRARLATLHAADLYLAFGCAQGNPAALSAFERDYLSRVPTFVSRIDRSPEFVDEVLQILRVRLLVAADGAWGKIGDYSGAGPLASWLAVVAMRAALDLRRPRVETVSPDEDLAAKVLSGHADVEGELLRERFRAEFQRALDGAMAALAPRDRNLLRLYFVEGHTIDKLALRFRVHRATAARWLQTTREGILDDIRRRLGADAGLAPSEVESLLGLMRSAVHLSLSRALGPPRR